MAEEAKKSWSSEAEYRRQKNAEEMRYQLVTFILMIFLTLVSFVAVGFRSYFPIRFVIPLILLLACIQVLFQLYYFMHAHQKGHGVPMLFMYSGIFTAFITILAFVTIVWW
jgi:cytochrome c oxidase, subunit IVB